jgi:hypothetical protein
LPELAAPDTKITARLARIDILWLYFSETFEPHMPPL